MLSLDYLWGELFYVLMTVFLLIVVESIFECVWCLEHVYVCVTDDEILGFVESRCLNENLFNLYLSYLSLILYLMICYYFLTLLCLFLNIIWRNSGSIYLYYYSFFYLMSSITIKIFYWDASTNFIFIWIFYLMFTRF